MSLRRIFAPVALVAVFAFAIVGCGKTENKIVVPTPTATPIPSPTLAPIAAVSSGSLSAILGQQVSLDGSGSSDPQGGFPS